MSDSETKWCPQHGYPLPCPKCGMPNPDESELLGQICDELNKTHKTGATYWMPNRLDEFTRDVIAKTASVLKAQEQAKVERIFKALDDCIETREKLVQTSYQAGMVAGLKQFRQALKSGSTK